MESVLPVRRPATMTVVLAPMSCVNRCGSLKYICFHQKRPASVATCKPIYNRILNSYSTFSASTVSGFASVGSSSSPPVFFLPAAI